jgi:hypothetical protein
LKEFRKANQDVMLAPKQIDQKAQPVAINNAAIFGRANRPSTPIKGIICGDYETATAILFREKAEAFASLKRNKTTVRAKGTKAQELCANMNKQKNKMPDLSIADAFKMKKF